MFVSMGSEHKLYQLNMHFEGNALQIYHLFPEEEKKDYNLVNNRLKDRCKPVDMLRGLAFVFKCWLEKLFLFERVFL